MNHEVFIAKTFLAFLRSYSDAFVANVHLAGSVKTDLSFMDVLRGLQKLTELRISQSATARLKENTTFCTKGRLLKKENNNKKH